MLCKLVHPTNLKIFLEGEDPFYLKKLLTYTNKSVQAQLKRTIANRWLPSKIGAKAYQEMVSDLKSRETVCLLKENDGYSTLPGLLPLLQEKFVKVDFQNEVHYPDPGCIPWKKKLPELYTYQKEAVNLLLKHKHAAIQLPTGSGKAFTIIALAKSLSLKTIIMAPSNNTAEQLYKDFMEYIGPQYVGFFGGNKKQSNKLFTIGLAQSFTRVEYGDDHWNNLKDTQVFITDESQFLAAETFKAVGEGIANSAPYRFSFSATQLRGDGAELLLNGLIGPIVLDIPLNQLVDQGFLAKPLFRGIQVDKMDNYYHDDPLKMTRHHLFYNKNVNIAASKIANSKAGTNEPVLILIDEIDQFMELQPLLKGRVGFAHGPLTKEHKKIVPEIYHKVDNGKLVDQLNTGKLDILVGTSAVSTGTNFKTVKHVIYLQGGRSPISVPQCVGRGTRVVPGKDSFYFYDFLVKADAVERHFWDRVELYNSLYPTFKMMEL